MSLLKRIEERKTLRVPISLIVEEDRPAALAYVPCLYCGTSGCKGGLVWRASIKPVLPSYEPASVVQAIADGAFSHR